MPAYSSGASVWLVTKIICWHRNAGRLTWMVTVQSTSLTGAATWSTISPAWLICSRAPGLRRFRDFVGRPWEPSARPQTKYGNAHSALPARFCSRSMTVAVPLPFVAPSLRRFVPPSFRFLIGAARFFVLPSLNPSIPPPLGALVVASPSLRPFVALADRIFALPLVASCLPQSASLWARLGWNGHSRFRARIIGAGWITRR